jgi:hypothetical protein
MASFKGKPFLFGAMNRNMQPYFLAVLCFGRSSVAASASVWRGVFRLTQMM